MAQDSLKKTGAEMGTVYHSSYTIPLPEGASVKGDIVTWTGRKGKKTGKLTQNGQAEKRVLVETDVWIAKFVDENNRPKTLSTKVRSKEAALRILHQFENEVERVRSGVITRAELNRAEVSAVPLSDHLNVFRTRQVAGGAGEEHINDTRRLKPKEVATKKRLLGMEFRTFLQALVTIPAQVLESGRRIIVRLLNVNGWTETFFRLYEALRRPLLE